MVLVKPLASYIIIPYKVANFMSFANSASTTVLAATWVARFLRLD
jgi:hypothetical protein